MSISISSLKGDRSHWGIFFISFATLMFEIALSRLLSITLWSSYAFLIISCALLGYGAAGSWLTVFSRPRHPFLPVLLFSLSLLPLFICANRLEFNPTLLSLSPVEVFTLVFIFLILAIPFFLTGLAITSVIRLNPEKVFSIYCYDLVGASLGCLCFFWLAPLTDEIGWLVVISLFAAISAFCFSESRWEKGLSSFVGCVLGGVLIWGAYPDLKMGDYKSLRQALQYPGAKITKSRWDGSNRIDWFKSPLMRMAPGLSLNYTGEIPLGVGMSVDGGFLTVAGNPDQESAFLAYLPGRILYLLTSEGGKTLVLDTLGGQDLDLALQHRGHQITAQTRYRLAAESLSRIYQESLVKVVSEKPRSFLAADQVLYDRIVLSMEGALPTGMSGMDSLKKDYLRTVEGIEQIYDHLETSGWAAFHLYLLPPARAEIRLLATIIEVLKQKGVAPGDHLGIFTTISTLMILVSENEWTDNDIRTFEHYCERMGYQPVYYPQISGVGESTDESHQYPLNPVDIHNLLSSSQEFLDSSVINYEPVRDDSPFFYHFLKLNRFKAFYHLYGGKWEGVVEGGLLLPLLLLGVSVLALLFIVIPRISVLLASVAKPGGLYYFLLLGFGFMMVEIAFIEKFTPFLGDPTYSFAFVLGGILLSSGVGSGLAGTEVWQRYSFSLPLLLLILLLYFFRLDYLLGLFNGAHFSIKTVLAGGLILIPGLLMGTFFPNGILAIEEWSRLNCEATSIKNAKETSIATAWCYNSFASVIGSALAMTLAVYTGISTLFIWAAVFYGATVFALRRLSD